MRMRRVRATVAAFTATGALALDGASAQDQIPPSIYDAQKHSVVKITGRESSGTGFIVSEEGHLITALHVIEHMKHSTTAKDIPTRIKVSKLNDYFCPIYASLVGASAPLDIAVYRITDRIGPEGVGCHQELRPLTANWHEDAQGLIGQTVYMIGNPRNCDGPGERSCFDVKATTITSNVEAGGSLADRTSSEGFSGGPVLTYQSTGHQSGAASVVGLIIATGMDADNQPYTRFTPLSSIQRAFWGFGITAGDRVRDYTPTLGRLLDQAAVIEESPSRLAALSREIEAFKTDANERIASLSRELELLKTRVEWTLSENNGFPILSLAPQNSTFSPSRIRVEVIPILTAAFTRDNAKTTQAAPAGQAISPRPHTIEIAVGRDMDRDPLAIFIKLAAEAGGGGQLMILRTFRQILENALDDINRQGNFSILASPDDVSSFDLRVHTTLSDGAAEITETSPSISVGREKFLSGT